MAIRASNNAIIFVFLLLFLHTGHKEVVARCDGIHHFRSAILACLKHDSEMLQQLKESYMSDTDKASFDRINIALPSRFCVNIHLMYVQDHMHCSRVTVY